MFTREGCDEVISWGEAVYGSVTYKKLESHWPRMISASVPPSLTDDRQVQKDGSQ